MDFNKKPKKSKLGSVDGFSFSPQSKHISKEQKKFSKYNNSTFQSDVSSNLENLRISKVDDFKGEGFTPNGTAPIINPGSKNKIGEVGDFNEVLSPDDEVAAIKQKKSGLRLFKRKSKEHKSHKKHHRIRFGLKLVGIVAVLALLSFGGLGLKAYLKTRGIFKGGSEGAVALNKNVDPTLLKGEGDGRVNVLLLGKGGAGHDGPDLTDTLLIASIDPVAKETALLSIPRDLWVKSSAGGTSKINAVYANAKSKVLNKYTTKQQTSEIKQQAEKAGMTAIQDTITGVIGIPLQYYAMVDFEGFKQAIDAVGGIEVNVKKQLYDPTVAWENNNNPLIAGVGLQQFNGKKALLYTRSRHGSARGDFDRTERQREVILALKDRVLSAGTFTNPLKVNGLIDAFGDHISTDFSLNEIMRVYDIVKGIDATKVQSIGLADPPNDFVTTSNISGQSVVVPRAGTFSYDAIKSYVRNTLKDSFLKSENGSVLVLNGTTTTGLATVKSDELKSYGYNVVKVGDAPTKTYNSTVLIDLTDGVKKYTKNYLEKRLGVKSQTKLPDTTIATEGIDFVIIVGSDDRASN